MSDHVSRETTPPAPASASGVFSHALPQAVAFADLLAGEATVRGLIGPREVPRLWERHLLNCAAVTDLIPEGSSVCDIGSGAGLPGIVIAIRRPDIAVTLVEPLLRRTAFLDLAVSTMGLHNVTVRRGRAEEFHDDAATDGGFDVVTSRAVAPLDRLARWSLPLVRDGGLLLAMKGSSAQDELDAARPLVRRLGGVDAGIRVIDEPWLDHPVRVISVRRGGTG